MGCDLLTVNDPDIIEPENLNTPQGLLARRAGAFGDFAIAYGGDASRLVATNTIHPTQILATGLLTDELKETASDYVAMDARRVEPTMGALNTFYTALHVARQAAEATAEAFADAAGTVPNADTIIAEMMNLAGFTYVFFGESFCSGVPFSRLTETGDIEYGEPLTTANIFKRATERFGEAIGRAQQAGDADLAYLAQVGNARALLNLAQFAEAASAARPVPTAFRYDINYSTNTPRQYNAVYGMNVINENASVLNGEAGVGVDYLDAFALGDPRTPWLLDPSGGFNETTGPHYHQLTYTSHSAPIPLATGVEARLVEAEAALQADAQAEFERVHNELRATLAAAAVGPISVDTMTADQQVVFHFRERALWMWLTGHRLGDMRRLVRHYGRDAASVFPSGQFFRPDFPTYGPDMNFPVPAVETNNPNFTECADRNP